MPWCPARYLLFGLMIVSPIQAFAQSEQTIEILVSSSANTCFIAEAEVPCGEVGSRLKAMGVPSGSHIHLRGDPAVRYELVHTALDSLDRAGYSTKVGFVVP